MNHEHISRTYEYYINGDDLIEYVDSNWKDFAIENAGEYLIPDNIIGKSIWRYITDDATISIYQSIFQRVRQLGTKIKLPFRCDSPGIRRFMELEVEPMEDNALHMTSKLLREEPRTFIHALSNYFKRTNSILTMCSWCKKVRLPEERWVEIESALHELELFQQNEIPMISHGICKECFSRTWPKYH